MGDMSINLASLPMGADPKTDQVVAWDELGRSIYQSQFGVQYYIEATAPPKGSAIRGAYNSLVQDPGGTLGAVGKNALAGMWGAVETPMNALRGMPITNGDVWNSAGLVSVGGAGMAAPEGALRSGAMRTTAQNAADDVLAMLKRGDAAKVTDEMMAAADPQTLWSGYDLPMDAASRTQRAGEMGFDTKGYHATTTDFSSFTPSDSGKFGGGVYTSPEVGMAEKYVYDPNGANTLPVAIRGPSIGLDTPVSENKAALRRMGFSANEVKANSGETVGGIAENTMWPSNVTAQQFYSELDKRMGNAGISTRTYGSPYMENITPDPTKIRSQFARFDPRLSHLKNLSASIMAGGLGLSNLLDYLNSQNGEPQ